MERWPFFVMSTKIESVCEVILLLCCVPLSLAKSCVCWLHHTLEIHSMYSKLSFSVVFLVCDTIFYLTHVIWTSTHERYVVSFLAKWFPLTNVCTHVWVGGTMVYVYVCVEALCFHCFSQRWCWVTNDWWLISNPASMAKWSLSNTQWVRLTKVKHSKSSLVPKC